MASKRPSGSQLKHGKKSQIEDEDALNRVIAKLSVLGDFFRHSSDDTLLLDADTLLGLYLIVGECIDSLKGLRGCEKEE